MGEWLHDECVCQWRLSQSSISHVDTRLSSASLVPLRAAAVISIPLKEALTIIELAIPGASLLGHCLRSRICITAHGALYAPRVVAPRTRLHGADPEREGALSKRAGKVCL